VTAVRIDLQQRPAPEGVLPQVEEVEFIADLDCFAEHVKCSCSAGDDNPY
jgi:hypothetical protein